MADTSELVEHLLLLEAQLLVVGQLLPLASSAYAEMTASGRHATVAQLVPLDDFCLGIAVLLAAYLEIDHVARHGPGNEDYQARLLLTVVGRNGDADEGFSFGCDVGDFYVFKNGEGLLFSCHILYNV